MPPVPPQAPPGQGIGVCRILSLDGGGAKGFYTFGVLKELEGLLGRALCESFDLVYGTSTGAIIAALVALGRSTKEIQQIYATYVPQIMGVRRPGARSAALADLSSEVFGQATFEDVKTRIGIVATEWIRERPMIFKSVVAQAHGRKGTFRPGFDVTIVH